VVSSPKLRCSPLPSARELADRGHGGAEFTGCRLDALPTGGGDEPEAISKGVVHLANNVEVANRSGHWPAILPVRRQPWSPHQGCHLIFPPLAQTLQGRRAASYAPRQSPPRDLFQPRNSHYDWYRKRGQVKASLPERSRSAHTSLPLSKNDIMGDGVREDSSRSNIAHVCLSAILLLVLYLSF
jgi:hypothetical protein